jgi:hypothetical protein
MNSHVNDKLKENVKRVFQKSGLRGFIKKKDFRNEYEEYKTKMVRVRMFLCKIGLHKWSRKSFIDYGPTSNVKTWRRYCKICGKRQTWVQAKGDKERFRWN